MTRIVCYAISILLTLGCAGDQTQNRNASDHTASKDTASQSEASSHKPQAKEKSTGTFGAEIDEEGSVQLADVLQQLQDTSATQAKLTGEVTSVCQKKGCWMKVALDQPEDTIMVRFKDYGFFVPKNAAGNEVVMKGRAYYDTMSVEKRRHYAKDAGMSEEEIQKINEPKEKLAFKASGVILSKD